MAQFTARANLQLPGGGSSGLITPDEPADIDVLNENFRKIDALLGTTPVATRSAIPSNPVDGQAFWIRDEQQIYVYDSNEGTSIPSALALPAGAIMQYAAATAPAGWLLCRGQTVPRAQYQSLFNAIGTTYGAGDGTSTFALPDLQGRVPVGLNSSETEFNALNKRGGAKTHTLTVAQMPSHNHTQSSHTHTIHGGNSGTNARMRSGRAEPGGGNSSMGAWHPWFGTGWNAIDNVKTSSVTPSIANRGGGGAHNNIQPYITLNYIIFTGR